MNTLLLRPVCCTADGSSPTHSHPRPSHTNVLSGALQILSRHVRSLRGKTSPTHSGPFGTCGCCTKISLERVWAQQEGYGKGVQIEGKMHFSQTHIIAVSSSFLTMCQCESGLVLSSIGLSNS